MIISSVSPNKTNRFATTNMFDGVAIHTEVAFTSLGPLAVRNALREPTAPYLLFAMTGSEIRTAGQVWRCFAEKTLKSSGRAYIANFPSDVRGHSSFGPLQYNSTPFSSGSRR